MADRLMFFPDDFLYIYFLMHFLGEMQEYGAENNLDEPTMEEKLASLDLLDDDKSKSSSKQEPSPTLKPPSADSVHILLKQALHAEDHALLLDCLYTRDEKVCLILL